MRQNEPRSISLPDLLAEFPFDIPSGKPPRVPVEGVVSDSRRVSPGDLFVAVSGGARDGHEYIPQAIEQGAAVVVGEQALEGLSVPYLRVGNSRQSLAHLAAAFYDYPARELTMIGVTGTDGKTTTCNLIYQILLTAGLKAGLISTVNAIIGNEMIDTGFHVTTPDPPEVQRFLAKMVEAGLTHVVLETTSHGWAQYRVDACEFDIGVVTNITHEHLDYHGSYEAYRAAKSRLFTSLSETKPKTQGNPRLAVLNRDDASYDFLSSAVDRLPTIQKISYGLTRQAELRAEEVVCDASGLHFKAVSTGFAVAIDSALVGAYNVSNCLAALAATVIGLELDPQVAAKGISELAGVPGRMERIDLGQNFIAIVDFAHTPNALKVALEAARQMTEGRVIAIFGSAGLRDREKRRMMAEVSGGLADLTVLTAEDPRTESLDGILAEMAAGAESRRGIEGKSFWRIPDRGEAMRFALRLAKPGDLVISCGKGHEQSMCFGTIEYSWDDRTAMRAALVEYLGIPGPKMPYLPSQDKSEKDWLES
jgi:UDP-N-acetylmuramoyl-L-alanyl-D-glutamate--2,6-diaminopimelate ligase